MADRMYAHELQGLSLSLKPALYRECHDCRTPWTCISAYHQPCPLCDLFYLYEPHRLDPQGNFKGEPQPIDWFKKPWKMYFNANKNWVYGHPECLKNSEIDMPEPFVDFF